MTDCEMIRRKLRGKAKTLSDMSGELYGAFDISGPDMDDPINMYRFVDAASDFTQAYEIAKMFNCLRQ